MSKQYMRVPGFGDQFTIPDMYSRGLGRGVPVVSDDGGLVPTGGTDTTVQLDDWLTTPGPRPYVQQQGINSVKNLVAGVAQPLSNTRLDCDAILFDVYSSAANSVFWGFSAAVTPTTGTEIRAGIPQLIGPDNTRQQWELQRVLEFMAAVVGMKEGILPLDKYWAPRVTWDASQIFVVAAANTAISVLFLLPPPLQ